MIYVGYPCIGKSSIAGKDNFIDLESSNFKQYDNWFKLYVDIAEQLSNQDYNVLLSSHFEVREELKNRDIQFIAIFPGYDLKDLWFDRLAYRWKNEPSEKNLKALQRWREYDEDIKSLMNEPYNLVIHNRDMVDFDLRNFIKSGTVSKPIMLDEVDGKLILRMSKSENKMSVLDLWNTLT